MHLKLRREHKEDYMRVGGSKAGLEYGIAKIIYSFKGLSLRRRGLKEAFPSCVNPDTQKQWTGLT